MKDNYIVLDPPPKAECSKHGVAGKYNFSWYIPSFDLAGAQTGEHLHHDFKCAHRLCYFATS